MKPYLLLAVLLVLPLTTCESPTAPEATPNEEIPADARVIERIVDYQPIAGEGRPNVGDG